VVPSSLAAQLLAAAVGLAPPTDVPEPVAPPPADAEPAPDPATLEAAKSAVAQGAAAFRKGEYAVALEHFERAQQLRPSAKLHYNVAVCHHQLMLAAPDEDTRAIQVDRAIRAYNRYLEANPEASDRDHVATTIRELGGTPSTSRGLKSAFDGLEDPGELAERPDIPDAPVEEPTDPPPEEPVTTPPPPPPPPTERYHARFHFGPHVGLVPQLLGNREVGGGGSLYLEAKLAGYLGARRRLALGPELAVWGGSGSAADPLLALTTLHAGAAVDYDFPVGRRHRTILSAGGMGGFARQAIRTGAEAAAPLCSADRERGRLVATRNGGVVGLRASVGVLFGARRWHEANFAVHPTLGIFGAGSRGERCTGEASDRPFANLGVRSPQVGVWAGFGYAFRF
jgi:tetratricopeptide (TPR) repeat protein